MIKKLGLLALAVAGLLLVFVLYRVATLDETADQPELDRPSRAQRPFADRLPFLEDPSQAGAGTHDAPDTRAIRGWFSDREVAIDAHCVDLQGRPLAGVEVTVSQAGIRSTARSDAHGAVRVQRNLVWLDWALSLESFFRGKQRRGAWIFDDGETQVRLVARLAGHADTRVWIKVVLGETVHAGNLVLVPAGSVSGRVVGEAGEPVEGAKVRVDSLGALSDATPLARALRNVHTPAGTSDANGDFVLERAPVGLVAVSAADPAQRSAKSVVLDVIAGRELRGVELVVSGAGPSGGTVEGRVVSSSGAPVALANVRALGGPGQDGLPASYSTGRSLADGSFRVQVQGVATLAAWDDEGLHGSARIENIEPGARGLVLRLSDPRSIAIEVAGAGGKAVPAFYAAVEEADATNRMLLGTTSTSLRELLDDVFSPAPFATASVTPEVLEQPVRLAIPRAPFVVRARAAGWAEQQLGPFAPDDVPPVLRFDLPPRAALHGRVLRAGRPLRGARVIVCRPLASGGAYPVNGFPARFVRGAEALTDRVGRFSFAAPDAPIFLRAEAGGSAASEVGPIAHEPERPDRHGTKGKEIEITLGRGGDLEGEVIVEGGRNPRGLIIGISRGDGFSRTQRTDAQGRFRFEFLTPGPWFVHEHAFEIEAHSSSASWDEYGPEEAQPTSCAVVEGRTTWFRLDLREPPGLVVRGRVRFGSEALAGMGATLVSARPSPRTLEKTSATRRLEPEGTFEVVVSEAGWHRLTIAPLSGPERARAICANIDVGAGGAEWSLDIETGTLEGEIAATERRSVHHLVRTPDGGSIRTRIDVDKVGRFRAERVPAGEGALVAEPPRSSGSDPASWPVLERVNVPVAGVERVIVR